MIVVAQNGSGRSVPFLCDHDGQPTLETRETDARLAHIRDGLQRVAGCHITHADTTADTGEPPAAPQPASRLDTLLETVHDPAYLAFLAAVERAPDAAPQLAHPFVTPGVTPDTPVVAGMYAAAREAARVVVDAAARVSLSGASRASNTPGASGAAVYALCRPPGHHAGPAWLGGYCFLNNAAIAVAALRARGCRRVAVLDIDYHFGNGTAAILDSDPGALYASLHCATETSYPYRPVQPAHPRQAYFPFAEPPAPAAYLAALDAALAAARAFAGEALVVSLGYDIIDGDPHGGWHLAPSFFAAIGRALARSGLPLLLVQEGGYRLPSLADCSEALARGILEETSSSTTPVAAQA